MIYLETICDDNDTFRIERQKDKPNGEWYSIGLTKREEITFFADNEIYIAELYYSLRDNPRAAMKELGIPYNKEHVVALKKILKKAEKLGWFKDTKGHSVTKF